jgi:hypothetical protein
MPDISSGSAMWGQSGGNATKSPSILVTRTFTPWISIPVNRPLETSSAEQSLCQANS